MAKLGSLLGIIPVKGNSERVPKKNVRPFADTTLLDLKLKQVQELKQFDDIVVSSEDPEVLKRAKALGYGIHERDPYYSTGSVPMSEVYTYLANAFKHDTVMWIQVTNPLAGADVYREGLEKYQAMSDQHDCLLSVQEIKEYIYFNNQPLNFKPNPWPRSQDLKGTYALNFVVNILPRKSLAEWGSLVGSRPEFMVVDSATAKDIDFMEDFEFCEHLYRKRSGLNR